MNKDMKGKQINQEYNTQSNTSYDSEQIEKNSLFYAKIDGDQNLTEYSLDAKGKLYFCMMGIVSLLGYNSILGSLDYFADNFVDYNMYFYLPLPAMVTFNIVCLGMPQIARASKYSTRVSVSGIGMMIILVLFPILSQLLSQSEIGFWVTMLLSLLWGIGGQVFNSSLVGLSSSLHPSCLIAYNVGSSASGIIIIILRIGAVLLLDSDTNRSTLAYFLSAGILTLIALFIHIAFLSNILPRLKTSHLTNNIISCVNQEHTVPNSQTQQQDNNSSDCQSVSEEACISEKFIGSDNSKYFWMSEYVGVARELLPFPFFMILSNICANMMYPAVSLKSEISGLSNTWSCIWIVFMHNIAIVAGKYFTSIRRVYNSRVICTLVLLRFFHYGIFITNAVDNHSILAQNWIICINILIFSFSSGYTDGALFVLASERQKTTLLREQAGFVMAFSLTFGIMIGIFLAIPFSSI